MELDLADSESIRAFAKDLKESFKTIDCLVCNAGVLVPNSRPELTKDGFEINVGVNHLGHAHLISLILNQLVRIVMVSSILLKDAKLNLALLERPPQQMETSNDKQNYSESKLMNALFARHLAKIYPEIKVYTVSPGWCRTKLHRNTSISWYQYLGLLIVGSFFMKSPKEVQ